MNAVTLLPYDGLDCPFDELYKIYNDGSHYIARRAIRGISRRKAVKRPNELDELFEDLYKLALQNVLDGSEKTKEARAKKLSEFILANIEGIFPDYPNLEKYVRDNVERKERNLWQREKRFRRKAYLNRWNYFVTFTYSDRKHTEETFRKKLREMPCKPAYPPRLAVYGCIRARQRKRPLAFPLSDIRSRRRNGRTDNA